MHRWLLLTGVALSAAAVLAPLAEGRRAQREIRQRHVYVSVTTSNGARVEGVAPKDFVVREDNATREVIAVSPAPPPSHLVLLVDNARDTNLIEVRASFVAFVRAMTSGHAPPLMMLETYAERPTTSVKFTSSDIALENGIKAIFARPGNGVYLQEAIQEVSKLLKTEKAERPMIVAFVDDASGSVSDVVYTKVEDALKAVGTSLWTIELRSNSAPDRERGLVVGDVTTWSGGQNRAVLSSQAVEKAFTAAADTILSRYDVTYGRPESLIPPSRLSVEVRNRAWKLTAPRWPSP